MKKPICRIRNRSEYNASLKQRGSGAIWVSPEAVENWTTEVGLSAGDLAEAVDTAFNGEVVSQVMVMAPD